MDSFKVVLEGPAPWGFRLQGGKDFNVPLSISRLTPGGKAAQAGVAVGDWVLSIDGENAGGLTHIEAQNKIRACGEHLSLGLSRAQPAQSKPQKVGDGPRTSGLQAGWDWMSGLTCPSGAASVPSSLAESRGRRPYLRPDVWGEKYVLELQSPRYTRLRDWHHQRSAHVLNSCATDQPARTWLTEAALPIPTPVGPGVPPSSSCAPRHLPWGQQDRGGVGPCQEPPPCRALNGRSCSQVPRTEAPAPASATPQEPWPGPTTPSPTSRPPWAVDPAFAERYAPDKTSTVLTRHTQPATPTPLQNRTSIVQAAAGGGPGGVGGSNGKTPVCHQCHKVIRGRYLVALGHAYHPEEFVCSQCGKVLEEGGFFEEKGAIFCPPCYDVRYAPSCAKCKKKITGEIMHALKMTWHVHCFTCAACKTPIRNRAFYMEEGAPYCERDYEKMFGTKCRGCDFKIDAGDRFLEALGFSWHDTCFVCAICQINLEGKTFYSKKDKPLCKSHAFSHV
nr:PDZ and LIM domain protein 7 [Vicugna pacos]